MTQAPPNPYESPQQASPSAHHYPTGRTSTMATLSLVFSCASLLIGPIGAIVGVILGHLALSEMRRDPTVTGRGLAIAGLVVGYVLVVIGVLVIAALTAWLFYNVSAVKQEMQEFPAGQPTPLEIPGEKLGGLWLGIGCSMFDHPTPSHAVESPVAFAKS